MKIYHPIEETWTSFYVENVGGKREEVSTCLVVVGLFIFIKLKKVFQKIPILSPHGWNGSNGQLVDCQGSEQMTVQFSIDI